jgi:hypothetical protein
MMTGVGRLRPVRSGVLRSEWVVSAMSGHSPSQFTLPVSGHFYDVIYPGHIRERWSVTVNGMVASMPGLDAPASSRPLRPPL